MSINVSWTVVIWLLVGLGLFLPSWNGKVTWIGKFMVGIGLVALALLLLGGHSHLLPGKLLP
jgi:Na+/phosphate symporter